MPPRRAFDWLEDGGASIVLTVAMALYAAFVLWVTRGTTLFVDEQSLFISDRGFHPSALLAPLNGHLFLFERLLYAVDFKLFGASFVFPRLIEAIGVVVVVGLLFVLVRRRLGAAAALAPAMLLLLFGSAWEDDLVPSGIATVYAVASGLAALLLLESAEAPRTARSRRSTLRELGVCALLVVSVCAWTLGVAFAIGALAMMLVQRSSWRRLWVAVLPLALYAAWLLWVRVSYVPAHGEVQHLAASNILLVPNYIANEAAAVMGALAGLNHEFQPQSFLAPLFSTNSEYGPVLAAAGLAALVLAIRRGSRSPTLSALICILLAFWVALALGSGFGRDPTTARYVYGGGILVLLIAAEAARVLRTSPASLAAMYLITVLALGGNLSRLRDGERFYRSFATALRARLTAVELARGHVSPTFYVAPPPSLESIQAGPYLAAVARIGSPAYSPAELLRSSEALRHDADAELVSALAIVLSPHPPAEPVASCRRLAGVAGFAVGSPGVTLRSLTGREVALRRFASNSTVRVGVLPAGRPVDLRIPTDQSARPWKISVSPASASLTVCDLAPAL
jgi:hypothetical protein